MQGRVAEIVAVALTVSGCVLATFFPFWGERARPEGRVVELTAVAGGAVWTSRDVSAANYWLGGFPAARPVVEAGRPVTFRLKSSDVVHSFYCPGLGIGPVEVYPGHVVDVPVTPQKGVYRYYCTVACGDPHFRMRGEVAVLEAGEEPPEPPPQPGRYWAEPPPPPEEGRRGRGAWLFRRMGCFLCHGAQGRGGVPNWNYVNDTVPALDGLAERLLLYEPEDVEAVVSRIATGVDLASLTDDPPVPRFNVVLAQLNSVREVIRGGSTAGKKDPDGLPPPLNMPPWGERLSDEDIDSIIAYLLSLQPPEEYHEYEEEEP